MPVRSYLVMRAKPRTFRIANRGLEGIETQMVGRDAELALIAEAFQTACEDKSLRQVTIVGEPGIGKSRLGLEFTHWLELLREPVRFFQGRPQPYGNNIPYGLLRDLLAWRFEILESDSQSVAQGKLAAGLAPVLGERAAEYTALIGELIGFDYHDDPHIAAIAGEAKQIRDRAFHALASYFRALQRDSGTPVVLLLDDLHWADEGSLDFVDHLVQSCGDVPLFILCLTRSTLYERRPLWGSGRSDHLRIDLAPLSTRGTRELIEALLGRLETVPTALRDLLASSAEGNPYFVEELIGMLIDDGVIVTDSEPWRVSADKLLDVRVPSTLAGVLQARIDSLPPDEKTALQQASVIGHVFWDEALQRIAPGGDGRPRRPDAARARLWSRDERLRRNARVRLQAPRAAPSRLPGRAQAIAQGAPSRDCRLAGRSQRRSCERVFRPDRRALRARRRHRQRGRVPAPRRRGCGTELRQCRGARIHRPRPRPRSRGRRERLASRFSRRACAIYTRTGRRSEQADDVP